MDALIADFRKEHYKDKKALIKVANKIEQEKEMALNEKKDKKSNKEKESFRNR
jgi:hypothetical protein